jgi:hypothetical protein
MKVECLKSVKVTIAAIAVALATNSVVRADQTAEVKMEEPAAEKEWSLSASFDIYSEYIFRGLDLSDDDVMLSPALSVTWKGFTAYYWGAFNDSDTAKNRWYEEHDLGLEYSHDVLDGKLTLTGGGLWYMYFDSISGTDTSELYGKAKVNTFLSPTATLYWDIDEFHGAYATLGIGHSWDLTKLLKLKEGMSLSIDQSCQLGIDLGYNNRATDSNIDLNDLLFGITIPFKLNDNFTIRASFLSSIALSSIHDIGQGNERIASAGVVFSY